MNQKDFEKKVNGLSGTEIVHIAMACGLLENRRYGKGDTAAIPPWLAKLLVDKGVVELVG